MDLVYVLFYGFLSLLNFSLFIFNQSIEPKSLGVYGVMVLTLFVGSFTAGCTVLALAFTFGVI